ncbi:hypothetical protein BsWGS_24384 [Bradybaena similaris]
MTPRDQLAAAFLAWHLLRIVSGSCDVRIAVKSGQDVEITSPNYPLNFSSQLHCFYDLTTGFTAGDVLRVSVLDVTLSCNDPDTSLEVFDAFSTSAMYLGKVCAGGVTKFVSPRERLYLVFKSRPGARNATSRGFKLGVKSLPEFTHCYTEKALVLSATLKPQHFISPYYPLQVAPNVHCRWLLKAPTDHRVHLDIQHADLKGSGDCMNFGLYIYDGKTSYDDERLATVCSNSSQSFCSTSNYLMVVFMSGANVLHSGSGVKLRYYSSVAGANAEKADSSLLFILIGVLLGLATFTIVMVILRFIVIPARMQALARRYHPNTASSSTDPRAATAQSMQSDPPPPYEATNVGNHEHKSRTSVWTSICGSCFLNDKPDMRSSLQNTAVNNDDAFILRNIPLTPGHIVTPQMFSQLTGTSVHTFPPFLRAGTTSANIQESPQTRQTTITSVHSNEYQELPDPIRSDIVSGSEVIDNAINDLADRRLQNEHAVRYIRVDSGYQGSVAGDSTSLTYTNSGQMGALDSEDTASQIHIHNTSHPSSERDRTSAARGGNYSNVTPYEIDDGGYEVPVSSHHYDSLSSIGEDGEDQGESVYDKLEFDVQDV